MESHRYEDRSITPEMRGLAVFAHSKVYRTEYTLNQSATTYVTVVQVQPEANVSLIVDQRFRQLPISLDNELLINQGNTAIAWGSQPGKTPAELLEEADPDLDSEVIAFAPTNAGWQRKAFWVKDGQPLFLSNDRDLLEVVTPVLGKIGDRWQTTIVAMSQGKPEGSRYLSAMSVGFSLPLLVKAGLQVPVDELLTDARIQADIRNLFDLGYGKKLPPEFWQVIRGYLPTSPDAIRNLFGQTPIIPLTNHLSPHDLELVKAVVLQYDLPYMILHAYKGHNLVGSKPLPFNRIPAIGIGHDHLGRLVVVAADGRLPESAGVTIPELAAIMKEWGIVNGGLGSAGGDVGLYSSKYPLSRPANLRDGSAYFRPVPSILAIR